MFKCIINYYVRIKIFQLNNTNENSHLSICLTFVQDFVLCTSRCGCRIQLPLKKLLDSSISSLVQAGLRHKGHPTIKHLFQHSYSRASCCDSDAATAETTVTICRSDSTNQSPQIHTCQHTTFCRSPTRHT